MYVEKRGGEEGSERERDRESITEETEQNKRRGKVQENEKKT